MDSIEPRYGLIDDGIFQGGRDGYSFVSLGSFEGESSSSGEPFLYGSSGEPF